MFDHTAPTGDEVVFAPMQGATSHGSACQLISAATKETGAKSDARTSNMAISKIRGKLNLRSVANVWRRKANNKALPALKPFIPHIVREEIIAMAQWCVILLPCG